MNDPKNILVAVDFSPGSSAAIEEAVRVGRQQVRAPPPRSGSASSCPVCGRPRD